MALDAAKIKANPALEGLTDEQITALTTLSVNDENTVIGAKIGEVHGNYQRDFEEASGLKQPAGVKTYDWVKSTVLPKVKSIAELETEVNTLKTTKADLEDKLKKNSGDEALKQKLTDTESQLTALKNQISQKDTEHTEALKKANEQNTSILLDREFDAALIGVQFKDEKLVPKEVRDAFLATAKAQALAGIKPEFVDDNGKRTLVFRDDKGEILRNPKNLSEPFTAKELLMDKITPILETGKSQQGGGAGGAGGSGGTGGSNHTLDLTGKKTQAEATDAITNYLMDQGLVRGSAEFSAKQMEIFKENKVSELPMSS